MHINMGMPVMKEAGARWLAGLYDKLRSEKSIVINGFKKVGIIDVVRSARESALSNEQNPTANDSSEDPFNDSSEDPFNSSTELEEC